MLPIIDHFLKTITAYRNLQYIFVLIGIVFCINRSEDIRYSNFYYRHQRKIYRNQEEDEREA